MEYESGLREERSGHPGGPEPEPGSNEPARPDSMEHCYVRRGRSREANGFYVYTRNKRLKTRTGCSDRSQVDSVVVAKAADAVSSNGQAVANGGYGVNVGGIATSSEAQGVSMVENEVEMVEVEVKEEPFVAPRSDGSRRSTRSVLKSREEGFGMENVDSKDLTDAVILEADGLASEKLTSVSGGSPKTRKMEMKMSKKILIKGRPTTVRELFETGLLEGYPVFYNGGKRGFPLRGTIKDAGILCSCSLCKGAQVVPPCQFEIHACNSYRRASQYICLENGKSLLDVVKECRNSSVKTLEETVHNFIGPLPVKETVICQNCKGPFFATSTAKVGLVCDSCLITLNPEFDAECVNSSPMEPLLDQNMSETGESYGTTPKRGRRGRKKRQHLEWTTHKKSTEKSLRGAARRKGQAKITKILTESAFALKSPKCTLVGYSKSPCPASNASTISHGSLKNKTTRAILKKSSNVTSPFKSKGESPSLSTQSMTSLKITKKDQRMHKMVFENDGLPDGMEVAYYSNGKKLRDGYKMGSGIMCRCCNNLVSPSQFEAHAGWASRRKPYMYIYTSNGVSLHEFAVSLLKGCKCPLRDNDDLCIICADGGKLVLCDGCPRAFHKECASLASIPRGKWYCTYCQNMFQRERFVEWNANAVAAGRISGIDPIEQITNRCIRIVKNPEEAEVIACVICRGKDFSKSGFGPRTVILCDQCEKEYHVGCLKKCKIADLKELPKGKWFCSTSCKCIYYKLQDLLNAGAENLTDSSLHILREILSDSAAVADADVRWRLLNGKIRSRETRVLLSQAVAIFHGSFGPIVDPETGRDFIPSLVYGSAVVSAGILRIFGAEIAELPLAATLNGNRGKGYFQLLYSRIEKLLSHLKVKNLVLPAADDAKSIWTDKFGFCKMPQERVCQAHRQPSSPFKAISNHRKTCWQMITFEGTSMLEKEIPQHTILKHDEADSEITLQ